MSRLDEFLELLCGRFDNARQLEELRQSGGPALPLARHVNTVCNDKIAGLPADFAGAFVLEESYYTQEGKTHASPHLFLFTEEGEAVKLTSYQLPKAADGEAVTYETLPPLSYDALEVSGKFTPALYTLRDGVWGGGQRQHVLPGAEVHPVRALLPGGAGGHRDHGGERKADLRVRCAHPLPADGGGVSAFSRGKPRFSAKSLDNHGKGPYITMLTPYDMAFQVSWIEPDTSEGGKYRCLKFM